MSVEPVTSVVTRYSKGGSFAVPRLFKETMSFHSFLADDLKFFQ